MNAIMRTLLRPFIWLLRCRHRCGYGVHSPFAFNLITEVIYERTPYYKYKELEAEQQRLAPQKDKYWNYESKKVKQLLFRLVNHVQPQTIVDVGTLAASSLYLKAGRRAADYTESTQLSNLFLEAGVPIDFLYLHAYQQPHLVAEVFNLCAARTTQASVFVVEGVGYSKAMKKLWKQLMTDERVGITFDLYDVGILFFDQTKLKQDYVICF